MNHIANSIYLLESIPDSDITPVESYKREILEKLEGQYDDLYDLMNLSIALAEVTALIQKQLIDCYKSQNHS